jgi:molybdenum cofactor cytidylyltransferase
MQLLEALRLETPVRLALVGAGGKTTALFQLARQLSAPVIVTTTTHLAQSESSLADRYFILHSTGDLTHLADSLQGVTLLTSEALPIDRLAGLSMELMDGIKTLADGAGASLLVEADGSRRRPAKAPAAHEPVIPDWVDWVIVCVGLNALGKPLDELYIHRPERFSEITGLSIGSPITASALTTLLLSPQGGLKSIPEGSRRIAVLNQADSAVLQAQGGSMAEQLLAGYERVMVASLGLSASQSRLDVIAPYTGPVYAAYTRVAAVILAAGGSTRLGQPKALLDYFGRPFVRQAVHTALQAGLSPVVVVTGAVRDEIDAALSGLGVTQVHNPHWRSGMSSSLQTGLAALPTGCGAVVFMLADQPQVPVGLLTRLVETHRGALVRIAAPRVEGRRTNPVLFDRSTFADLMELQGDVGGRVLFSKYPVSWIEWADDRLLMDVDTPEDYVNLLAAEEAG